MEARDVAISSLISDFQSGQLAVLAGAGVSMCYPSGLPGWNALKVRALEAIQESLYSSGVGVLNERSVVDRLVSNEVPPEMVFEALAQFDSQRTKELIQLALRHARPSIVHELIARLARNGLLRVIVTTNFDTLFEQALTQDDVDFVQIATAEDFVFFARYGIDHFLNPMYTPPRTSIKLPHMVIAKEADLARQERVHRWKKHFQRPVVVVKVHGTIDRPESMLLTTRETSEEVSTDRGHALRFILSQYHMLYLGYSGGDLDIAPVVCRLRTTYDAMEADKIPVIAPFDQYDEATLPEELFHLSSVPARKAYWVVLPREAGKNPSAARVLSTYGADGQEIAIDLEDLTRRMADRLPELGYTLPDPLSQIDKSATSREVETLSACVDAMETTAKLLAVARLFSELSAWTLAAKFAREAERRAVDISERLASGRMLLDIHVQQSELVEAVERLRELKRLAYGAKDAATAIEFRLHEGHVLVKLGLYDDALEVFKEVAAVARGLATTTGSKLADFSPVWAVRALSGMAACYSGKQLFEHAAGTLRATKDFLEECRHGLEHIAGLRKLAELRANTSLNLAYALGRLGKTADAEEELVAALKNAAKSQQPDVQLLILDRLVGLCAERGEEKKASVYAQKAAVLYQRGIRKPETVKVPYE